MRKARPSKKRIVLKHLKGVVRQLDVVASPANKHRTIYRVLYLKLIECSTSLSIAELFGISNIAVSVWLTKLRKKTDKLKADNRQRYLYFKNCTNGFLMYLLVHDTDTYLVADDWFTIYTRSHKPITFGKKRLQTPIQKRKRAENFEYLLMTEFLSYMDVAAIYNVRPNIVSEQVKKDGYSAKVRARYNIEVAERCGFHDDLDAFLLWLSKNPEAKTVCERITNAADGYQFFLRNKTAKNKQS